MGIHREADLSLKRVKTLLNDKGYQEVITYSFVDPKVQQMIHPGVEALLLPSPISVEMSAMRVSLLSGLLGAVACWQPWCTTRTVSRIVYAFSKAVCVSCQILRHRWVFVRI